MKRGFDYIGVGAVTICHDGEGNYLLGKRSDKCPDEHFRWDIVGAGGVEFGETLVEAVMREVKEECGADVKEIEPLGFREVHREHDGKPTHWMAFDFKVEIDRAQVTNPEPDKCLEMRWCKLDEFPEPMHSQWPKFYEQHKEQL